MTSKDAILADDYTKTHNRTFQGYGLPKVTKAQPVSVEIKTLLTFDDEEAKRTYFCKVNADGSPEQDHSKTLNLRVSSKPSERLEATLSMGNIAGKLSGVENDTATGAAEESAQTENPKKKSSARIIWRVRVARSHGGHAALRATATHFYSSREKAHAALFGAVHADIDLTWKKVQADHEVRIGFALDGWRYDCWLDKVEHTALIDAVDGDALLGDNINIAYSDATNVRSD